MSDYGRIGDYIGPVAAKKLSAVDIDANSSNQHEFGGNDALRRLLGTGEDRRASQGHGIPTALMYLSDDDAPAVADLETTWYDARGIEYEAQARTENGKKPDFLFPSQAAYEDPAFPEEQLRMLASKTSIKDRFRQVADEANRIRDKHLFTLTPGDVTHPKLAQLDELHIHLVMPKVVKESYDDLIQGETMTFSRFIEEVQGLQAGRPQSLTLL